MAEQDPKEDGGPREGRHAKNMRGKDPAAPNVVFHLHNDGLEPRPAPWGFIARNPLEIAIPPGQTRKIDLQVSSDTPLLVWPTRAHSEDTKVESQIVPPGTNITVTVHNPTQLGTLIVDDGEGLLCLHPLFYNGTSSAD